MEKLEEKYYKHDYAERLLHWGNALVIILLTLSGLQIHHGGFTVFGSMNNARYVHFISMYLFIFMGIIYVYQFFALGKYKVSLFKPSDIKDIIPVAKYYLFVTDKEPHFEKYNPMQKLAYNSTIFMALVMVFTGFALYWPKVFVPVVKFFGGLGYVRLWHFLFTWVFIAFLMIHTYLVFSEDLRKSLFAMFTGYAPKEKMQEEEKA